VVGIQDNGGVNDCGSSGKKDSSAAVKQKNQNLIDADSDLIHFSESKRPPLQ
jgi:hypothetical protein